MVDFVSFSSIINIPGESTLRRDFLRLQLANKERSELIRRQQLEQQQNEEHKRQLLAERQKRIEEQKEQRRRLEEVACLFVQLLTLLTPTSLLLTAGTDIQLRVVPLSRLTFLMSAGNRDKAVLPPGWHTCTVL